MINGLATKLKEAFLSISHKLKKIFSNIHFPDFSKLKGGKSSKSSTSGYSYPAPAYLVSPDQDKKFIRFRKFGSFLTAKFASLRSLINRQIAKFVSKINKDGRLKISDKSVRLFGTAIASVIFLLVISVNFGFVKVSQGIDTTRGPSENKTMFISKTDTASSNDLVVAVLPGTGNGSEELLVMGTIFSSNEEFYAIYDGEVIWQVPFDQIRGKVLFAKPTQSP
jgi:hypothetical protein